MNILIRGAGDLATGIASRLFLAGHRIVMTETEVPLTVRRYVALSRAVYEGKAQVETMTGVLCRTRKEAQIVLNAGEIPVIVDPQAKCRSWFRPDVIVDAILAKRNIGTEITDAPFVIGVGPGFCAGKDCHCVVETKRGHTLGSVIWDGEPIANTGVPGNVGGYTIERLIRAAEDGLCVPQVQIGDFVQEGQVVAVTGGRPVYAQMTGIVRGMLQEGVTVTRGLKIGDIDARCEREHCYTISDKARAIGGGVLEAVCRFEKMRGRLGVVLLAAGSGSRFGGGKLHAVVGGEPLYKRMLDRLSALSYCVTVVVTGDEIIEAEAAKRGFFVVQNKEPEKGIARSIRLGLSCLEENAPHVEGAMFAVCDQPNIRVGSMQKILCEGSLYRNRIICAGRGNRRGNPVYWSRCYFDALQTLQDDVGGRSLFGLYPDHIHMVEVEPEELLDIDRKEDLKEYDKSFSK